MSQILSTFTTQEQDRFAAFRRSAFKGDVVSNYVAFCLAREEEKRYAQREGAARMLGVPLDAIGSSSTSSGRGSKTRSVHFRGKNGEPRLSNLVAPNCAQEITVVVSALAKAYAQRLVTAARRVADAEGYPSEEKLLPQHYREAYQRRVQAGLDPGFFLQPPQRRVASVPEVGVNRRASAAVHKLDKYQIRLAAARAVQEAYDASVGNTTEENEGTKSEEDCGSEKGESNAGVEDSSEAMLVDKGISQGDDNKEEMETMET